MIDIAPRNQKKMICNSLYATYLVFLDHDVLRHQRIFCHKTVAENASLYAKV